MAPMKLWNLLACQSILSPRCLSPWKPMMERSLLNAGGTMEINRRRIPKQKLAPECTKTSISFLKMSESGSWWICFAGGEVPVEVSGDTPRGEIASPFIDELTSACSMAAACVPFFDKRLDDSDFVSGHAALEVERSLVLGSRALCIFLCSINFSSIFMMASRAM